MTRSTSFVQIQQRLSEFDSSHRSYATALLDYVLNAAIQSGASDVHFQPTPEGLEIRWRIDGVLQLLGQIPSGETADIVTRLKVMAELLTYQSDSPQEGRIREQIGDGEMRVSTFPTLYGERAVVRLFASSGRLLTLRSIGLPEEIEVSMRTLLTETSGAVLVTGPAGSGKTTTVYAMLREIVDGSSGEKSIVSLEDPIESALIGVSQSQVNANGGFDLTSGLRSLMRQDPEVILVGEVRDRETAETVFQASLTGHLVLTTYHAGSAAGAVSRLSDMGIEPYLLRSGVLAILGQRLVRRLCECSVPASNEAEFLDLPVQSAMIPNGCENCRNTGYHGRTVLAELLQPSDDQMGRAILCRESVQRLEELAADAGMVSRWERANDAVNIGVTSPAEIRRVLGFRRPTRSDA